MARPKTGGRKKGTPNKDKTLISERVAVKLGGMSAIEKMCERFLEAESDLDNPQRADKLICEIASYCHAKPKAVEQQAPPPEVSPDLVGVSIDLEERVALLKSVK